MSIVPRKFVYLCSPYTHPDPLVREARFQAAIDATAYLSQNYAVFSPIVQGHVVAQKHKMPTNWEFWKEIDEAIILCSEMLVVLMLDGWRESVGAKFEIQLAKDNVIPIVYMGRKNHSGEFWFSTEIDDNLQFSPESVASTLSPSVL